MHTHFEELCVTAIAGEITDSERALLDAHLRECDDCRNLIEHLRPEVVSFAPTVAELLMVPADPPEGIRERFLQRATDAGLAITAGDPAPSPEITQSSDRPNFISAWIRSLREAFYAHPFRVPAWCLILLVCFYVGFQVSSTRDARRIVATAAMPRIETANEQSKKEIQIVDNGAVSKGKLAATESQLSAAEEALAKAQAENYQLEHDLQAAVQAHQSSSTEIAVRQAALDEADAQVTTLKNEVATLHDRILSLDVVASAQEKQTIEVQDKLAALRAEADRIYAARGTAETMISSRNLHIIDVYDTSSSDKERRAFGRVFFVEGKSLVFYAYDLPNPKKNQTATFQFWGEGAGAAPTTYRLGLLHPDTTGQSRWMVSCDDPKVLGQLRAVFIAPATSGTDPPTEKMMYALLGSANHP